MEIRWLSEWRRQHRQQVSSGLSGHRTTEGTLICSCSGRQRGQGLGQREGEQTARPEGFTQNLVPRTEEETNGSGGNKLLWRKRVALE
ncbi:hypothetical protein EYF80_047535 [Liparis tanakae]|uniref:Uncharacterized protein n=1 Tax=Liparis tanakae TaxID=230148 RepID=A0A4Z2FM35_9TELE|nr:hypothetical protein EYF80_047535 [Liparis tanakae]